MFSSRSRLLFVLPVFALLGGCQTTLNQIPDPLGLWSDGIPEEGRFIDVVEAPSTLPPPDEAERMRTALLANSSAGEAGVPALRQYAQDILNAIIAVAPPGAPPARVHILANPGVEASALPGGDIYLFHGIFSHVRHEDELAFLLAHEYSHVFLQHSPETALAEMRPYIVTAVDFAMMTTDRQGSAYVRQAVQLYGSDIVARDLIVPVYDRAYERQADLLGLDLMVAAGYNPEAAIEFLRLQRLQEEAFETLHAVERNELEKAFAGLSGQGAEDVARNPAGFLVGKFTEALGDVQKRLAARHDDAEDRIAMVLDYIGRAYADTVTRPWRQDRLDAARAADQAVLDAYADAARIRLALPQADSSRLRTLEADAREVVSGPAATHAYSRRSFAELRARQGRYDLALRNLDLIEDQDGVLPLSMELDRLDWQAAGGQRGPVFDRLRALGEHYDWPLLVYTRAIAAAKAEGRSNEATTLGFSCVAKFPQQRAVCAGEEAAARS